jgi:hypothetical protein
VLGYGSADAAEIPEAVRRLRAVVNAARRGRS